MFRGDHPDLLGAMDRGVSMARRLGHPRTGSEHLLLALCAGSAVGPVLDRHGATGAAVAEAVRRAAPRGAGAAADRGALASLGIDVDRILSRRSTAVLDRPTVREPLFPLGLAEARRRCARSSPPIGLDAQAAYAASLRLALARRERDHRTEHLALALVALDPGVAWVITAAGLDPAALLAQLADAFPPPHRHGLMRAERRVGRGARHNDLVRRYQRTTGRTCPYGSAIPALIAG
jgi:Clp amino terminal domain, pathogenicity island component